MVYFYEYSTSELVRLLGNRFKEYRIRCNLTQKDVSGQSAVGWSERTYTCMVRRIQGISRITGIEILFSKIVAIFSVIILIILEL